jgi:hypothetical protein
MTAILVVAIAGCAGQRATAPPTTAAAEDGGVVRSTAYASSASRGNVHKGRKNDPPQQMRMRLNVYVLTLPLGTISRNEEFWQRVNEQALDVATYDLLYKNGVRVGEAPISEYKRFAQLIEDHPASYRHANFVTPEAKDIDLEIHKESPSQTVWYFNGINELIGKTFDKCQNYLTLSYQPAPRKPTSIRVVLCPVVKETRKQLQWVAGQKELEVAFTQPQRLYDVNLRADVSLGSFLIIAPSAEATWPGSIGNRFFIQDGAAEQLENVLLLVPSQMRVTE